MTGDEYETAAAYAELQAAVTRLARAQGVTGMVLEWTLATVEHIDHGDGTSSSAYNLHSFPVEQGPHRALGLIEWARLRVHRAIGEGRGGDE